MALNSEEMKSIKEKVVAPLPRLANFIPTSSNQSPTVPKVSLLSEWIRNYARESGDLKKSPQLALAVYNLFDINEFLATSKETSESNNVMISLLEVIAKLSVQKTENTVLTTQPIGNPEETLTAFLNAQQHKEEEILDQETLNYFSQESTLARLEVYQTQQEAMDRRLKLIPGELHRHKELIFSVLLSLSNAGQPFPRPTMVDSMSDR
jgi:hypothetical protein